ncbi:MAG: UDP-2,4-diacetamido-2,4,6-trideoxy-beta-L-altropyranose hydrolase [Lachnospiraceae bacterium]
MIWIRADANREIGSGHIMRCLSVATELKKRGEQVLFVTADEAAAELLSQRGQAFYALHTDYRDMEAELSILLPRLTQEKPGVVLVDSYFATESYLTQLSNAVKTVYMDDRFAFPYPVDMVINYNIYASLLPYREHAHPRTKEFLLGCDYVPLREEFKQVPVAVREYAKNVLITTGGSDKFNLAGQILEAVLSDRQTRNLHYHVVSGAFNSHLPELKKIEVKHENVHIYQNVTNMSELMKQCDIAITAAGSTLYELCAIGIPILCFSFVDNQEKMVQTFVDKELVHFGGDYKREGSFLFCTLAKKLCELIGSRELRQSCSDKARKLVDGNGAARIAEALRDLSGAD